jgi:two-component system chemotaxis response regulator CheY
MGKRVLVVDDSTSMRQMVSFTLTEAGFTVIEGENGQQGLDQAKNSGGVDLVVTDLNMPVMDGIEMIRNLRQLPAFQFTPILMLTTETDDGKKAKGKEAGATGWIVKPFEPTKLLKTIERVLPS